MTMRRRLGAGLAISGLALQAGIAHAAPRCVTKDEARAGIAFMIPALVRGLREKCAPLLPEGSYLATAGDRLIARFQLPQFKDSAALETLVGKVVPTSELPASANGPLAQVMAETIVDGLKRDLKPASCPSFDKALALVDPLPPENMIGLFEVIVGELVKSEARKRLARGGATGIQLCDAERK